MRIISGSLKGRKLIEKPNLKHLRPTSDKNRETLFNLLSSAKFIKKINFDLNESSVLDVCCGTGSVSFEAISRGAQTAFLIDNNSASIELAKENASHLKVENQVEFLMADVKKSSLKISQSRSQSNGFDLIYIDPPYKEDYLAIINNLLAGGFITKKSLLAIEATNEVIVEIAKNIEQLKLLEARKSSKLTSFGFFIKK